MVTFIEIISGSRAGVRFRIYEGITFGRTNADIMIDDPKISGTHARVERDTRKQLVVVDLDSANGIYINDRRVKKVTLIPGVTFELGRTMIRVIQVAEQQDEAPAKKITWRDIAKESISGMDIRNIQRPGKVLAFSPAIALNFIQGIQAGQSLVLGYGPRKAGVASLDIELTDEATPELAFEILPGSDGFATIQVANPDKVLVNNQSLSSETLQEGTLISFGKTVIRIAYL